MIIKILEALISLIFFSNKIGFFLSRKNPIGWWLAAIASILAIFYFLFLNLFVYAVGEVGLFILTVYGAVVKKENRRIEIGVESLTFFIALILAFYTFQGQLTILEFFSAVGMLVAFYLLHPKNGIWKMKWGWAILAATHVSAAYLGYVKHQEMFAHFQIASAIIGIGGALKES